MPAARRTLALAASVLVAACQLDWGVRSDPGDASASVSADAAADTNADAGGADALADVSAEAADCAALTSAVGRARDTARACTLGAGQCTTTVKDACGCDVVVAESGAQSTIDYEDAVAALVASACNRGCTSGCPASTPRACLQGPSGTACSP